MTFENPSGAADAQWLTSGLPSMLLTGLGQTPGLDVVGSQRVDEVLKDLGLNAAALDKSRVLEVGRRVGAGALVVGTVFKTGADLRIDVQVQDVASGRLLGAHSVRGTDAFPLADDLTSRIRQSLNVTAGPRRQKGLPRSRPVLPEAPRRTPKASKPVMNQRDLDAVKRLRRAIDIDPSFASGANFTRGRSSNALG